MGLESRCEYRCIENKLDCNGMLGGEGENIIGPSSRAEAEGYNHKIFIDTFGGKHEKHGDVVGFFYDGSSRGTPLSFPPKPHQPLKNTKHFRFTGASIHAALKDHDRDRANRTP